MSNTNSTNRLPKLFMKKFIKHGLQDYFKLGVIKEIFELLVQKRKFHMFPIIILLIALIGVTALAQSGLVAFIYPI